MAKLIPEEGTRTILLDSVAEIYMSFEDEVEHEGSPERAPMMTSSTLDVFIPEVCLLTVRLQPNVGYYSILYVQAAVHATVSAARDIKAAIKTTSSLICW